MITTAQLKEYLRYEPETGKWFWVKSPSPNAPVGSAAGWKGPAGRRLIRFRGHQFVATRLAWFYMTGKFPGGMVDHKNRIKMDDRWVNIRGATNQENCRNSNLRRDNSSGYKGVSLDRGKRWRARITLMPGKTLTLGYFHTREAAASAYANAAHIYFGEFACTS